MILPGYNFAMSISRYFDDYKVKALCAKKFRRTYMDCSDLCEYWELFRPIKTLYSVLLSTLLLRLCKVGKTWFSSS